MKKYLIIVMVLVACNLMSTDITIVWIGNADNEEVTHYRVYKAEGNDSTALNLTYIGDAPHTIAGAEIEFTTTFDSTLSYVKAGVEAVNAVGVSERSESRVYLKGELALPSAPLMASPAIRRQ